jgi:hypothetical protein
VSFAWNMLACHSFHNHHSAILSLPQNSVKAFYIPPKIEQLTIHGGTFVLSPSASSIMFVHHDESPGTHADTSVVVDIPISKVTKYACSVYQLSNSLISPTMGLP